MAYAVVDNSPGLGYISWTGVSITYMGVKYAITNGQSCYRYVFWKLASPTVFQTSDAAPVLSETDCIVFINNGGIAFSVLDSDVMHGDVLVDGSIGARAIAAGAIRADHIAAGAITADHIGVGTIDAKHMKIDSIEADFIQAGAIVAGKVAAGAIGADEIAAGAIVVGKLGAGAVERVTIANGAIGADQIEVNSITAGQIAVGAIGADQIASDAVTAGKILAGSILASKISVIAADLVNNVTLNGKLNGWGLVAEDGTGTPVYSTYDATEKAIKVTTTLNASVRSIGFKVDHSKIYRVSCRIKKSAANGNTYIGLTGSPAAIAGTDDTSSGSGSELISSINQTTRVVSAGVANFYNKGPTAGTTSYVESIFFIVGARRSELEFPEGATTACAKLAETTNYLALRFLNWDNTVSTSMYVRDISVTEVGAGIIVAENIKAGAIIAGKLGVEAVDAGNIKAGAITTGQLATGVITSLTNADSAANGTALYRNTDPPDGELTIGNVTAVNNNDGSRNVSIQYTFSAAGTLPSDFIVLLVNFSSTDPSLDVADLRLTLPLPAVNPTARTYVLDGVPADKAIKAAVALARNTSGGVKFKAPVQATVLAAGTVSITAGGTFSGTASGTVTGDVTGKVNNVPVATVTSGAANGQLAFSGTVNVRSNTAPSNNAVLGTCSLAAVTDGSVIGTVAYTYAQGTIPADGILVYFREGGGTVLTSDPCVMVNPISGTMKFSLKPGVIYSFGVQAIRSSDGGYQAFATIAQSTNQAAVAGNITVAIGGTALINSVAASTVTGNAANGAAVNTWLDTTAPVGSFSGHNTVALTQNADGSVNLDLSWAFAQSGKVADRLLVAIKKGTVASLPGQVLLTDITSGLVDVYEYPIGATAAKIMGLPIATMVAGVSTKVVYSAGIACAKPTIGGTTAISAVSCPDPAWRNKTVTEVKMGANADNFWDLTTGELKATIGTDKTFHLDPVSGDAELTNVPIRSYQGTGAQRRATQLDNDSLDFIDCPDTSPATDELLVARIGRLGVGGAVLMDGDINVPIEDGWGSGTLISSGTSRFPSTIEMSNRTRRLGYGLSGTGYVERLDTGSGFGSATTIHAATSQVLESDYIERTNGEVRFCFMVFQSINNYYIYEKLLVNGVWETTPRGVVTDLYVWSCAYGELSDGTLIMGYQRSADGHYFIRQYNDDTDTWGAGVEITSFAVNFPDLFKDKDGVFHLAYSVNTTYYLYEILSSDNCTTWSATPLLIKSGAVTRYGKFADTFNGDIKVIYQDQSTTEIRFKEKIDGVWGAEQSTGLLGFDPSFTLFNDGSYCIFFTGSAYSGVYQAFKLAYAQIGAGIIESGGNDTNGRYIKYGDGTMVQWGRKNLSAPSLFSASGTYTFYEGPTYTVTLQQSFFDTKYCVVANAFLNGNAAAGTISISAEVINNISFGGRTNSAYNYTPTMTWQAIGRWKA